jgi:hypothetical protein
MVSKSREDREMQGKKHFEQATYLQIMGKGKTLVLQTALYF